MPACTICSDSENVDAIGGPADRGDRRFANTSPGLPATPRRAIPSFMPAGTVRSDHKYIETICTPTARTDDGLADPAKRLELAPTF